MKRVRSEDGKVVDLFQVESTAPEPSHADLLALVGEYIQQMPEDSSARKADPTTLLKNERVKGILTREFMKREESERRQKIEVERAERETAIADFIDFFGDKPVEIEDFGDMLAKAVLDGVKVANESRHGKRVSGNKLEVMKAKLVAKFNGGASMTNRPTSKKVSQTTVRPPVQRKSVLETADPSIQAFEATHPGMLSGFSVESVKMLLDLLIKVNSGNFKRLREDDEMSPESKGVIAEHAKDVVQPAIDEVKEVLTVLNPTQSEIRYVGSERQDLGARLFEDERYRHLLFNCEEILEQTGSKEREAEIKAERETLSIRATQLLHAHSGVTQDTAVKMAKAVVRKFGHFPDPDDAFVAMAVERQLYAIDQNLIAKGRKYDTTAVAYIMAIGKSEARAKAFLRELLRARAEVETNK